MREMLYACACTCLASVHLHLSRKVYRLFVLSPSVSLSAVARTRSLVTRITPIASARAHAPPRIFNAPSTADSSLGCASVD